MKLRRPTGRFILGILPLALALAGPLLAGPSQKASHEISVELQATELVEGERAPVLLRSEFAVDAFAGMAVLRLSQQFRNDNDRDLDVRAALRTRGENFEILAAGLGQDGRRPLFLEKPEPPEALKNPGPEERLRRQLERTNPQSRKRLEKERNQKSKGLESETFGIGAGEEITIVTRLKQRLEIDSKSRFVLKTPVLQNGAGSASGSVIPFAIDVHHHEPLDAATSSTDAILFDFVGDRTIVEPVSREISDSRPLEFRYRIGSRNRPTVAGFIGHTRDDGARSVEAVVTPPLEFESGEIRPKEVTFLVDTSGSMRKGEDKIGQARRAVDVCLKSLRPEDRFNLIDFDSRAYLLSPELLEPTEERIRFANDWLAKRPAEGGTNLLPALTEALAQKNESSRHKMIVVVTDGMLQDETPVMQLLEKELGDRRLFVVGAGQKVRQETLLRLAEYGRGAATFFGKASELEAAITDLFKSISDPLAWDVGVDWGGADVEVIQPTRLPDLYAGRSVRILAWVKGNAPETLEVRMATTEGARTYEVRLPRLPEF